MSDIFTGIQTVGFPIVAFLICAYGLKYAYDKSLEQQEKNLDSISELAEAINENTKVLATMVQAIEDRS